MNNESVVKTVSIVGAVILSLLWQSLAIALLWLALIVPIFPVRALSLAEAFAVGMFINYFIAVESLSARNKEKDMAYAIVSQSVLVSLYLISSYIFSMFLL